SGKIKLQSVPVDLREVAERSLQSLRAEVEAQRHDASLLSTAAPVIVEGDPVRLEQVVGNLLNNAIKYTPPGGVIRVAVERQDADGVIRILDNGIGIEPQMLRRIFDLFTQAEGSLDRSQGGL